MSEIRDEDRQYLAWDAEASEWLLFRVGDLSCLVEASEEAAEEPPSGVRALPMRDESGHGVEVVLERVGQYTDEADRHVVSWEIRDADRKCYGRMTTRARQCPAPDERPISYRVEAPVCAFHGPDQICPDCTFRPGAR
jgi:hypothetical protein